jgi:hypothetical protein
LTFSSPIGKKANDKKTYHLGGFYGREDKIEYRLRGKCGGVSLLPLWIHYGHRLFSFGEEE